MSPLQHKILIQDASNSPGAPTDVWDSYSGETSRFVLYPLLAVAWLLLWAAFTRVQAVSGLTRAIIITSRPGYYRGAVAVDHVAARDDYVSHSIDWERKASLPNGDEPQSGTHGAPHGTVDGTMLAHTTSLRGRGCASCADAWLFQTIEVCGAKWQPAAWTSLFIFVMALLFGIIVDSVESRSGAGAWCVSFLAPITVLASATPFFSYFASCYGVSSALYIIWTLCFSLGRGQSASSLLYSGGGSLVPLAVHLLTDTTPYIMLAFVYVSARRYTATIVQNRVHYCLTAASKVETSHKLAIRAARVQMPPFALRLLHGDTTGVELEQTTAVLIMRIYSDVSAALAAAQQNPKPDATPAPVPVLLDRSALDEVNLSDSDSDSTSTISTDSDSSQAGRRSDMVSNLLGPGQLPATADGRIPGEGPGDRRLGRTSSSMRQQHFDELKAKASLLAVGAIEKVLKSTTFRGRATCVSVVGQDVVVAVHGEGSEVFYRDLRATSHNADHMAGQVKDQSEASGNDDSASASGRLDADLGEGEQPITLDAAGCFNISTAVELAVKASQALERKDAVHPGCSVRLGAGVAYGSTSVCGFMSSQKSAHRWSVFGDGASEAYTLASQGPGLRLSARAMERLQSPTCWGIVYASVDESIGQGEMDRRSRKLAAPWRVVARRGNSGRMTEHDLARMEHNFFLQWRDYVRKEAKAISALCPRKPMPIDAAAFGATVPANHFYQIDGASATSQASTAKVRTPQLRQAGGVVYHHLPKRHYRYSSSAEARVVLHLKRIKGLASAVQGDDPSEEQAAGLLNESAAPAPDAGGARTEDAEQGLSVMSRNVIDPPIGPIVQADPSKESEADGSSIIMDPGSSSESGKSVSGMYDSSDSTGGYFMYPTPAESCKALDARIRKELGIPSLKVGAEQVLLQVAGKQSKSSTAKGKRMFRAAQSLWKDQSSGDRLNAAVEPTSWGTDREVDTKPIQRLMRKVSTEGEPVASSSLLNSNRFDKQLTADQFRFRRSASTRLVQSPFMAAGCAALLLVYSLLYAGRTAATVAVSKRSTAGTDAVIAALPSILGGALVVCISGVLLLRRRCKRGARDTEHAVLLTGDSEDGRWYALGNVVMLTVLLVCSWLSRGRALMGATTGCISRLTMAFLPASVSIMMLLATVFLYGTDLHGLGRPTQCGRLVILCFVSTVALVDVLISSTEWGNHAASGGELPSSPAATEPVMLCDGEFYPLQTRVASLWRVLLGLQGVLLALVSAFVHDYQGAVIVKLGDYILVELQKLSAKLTERKKKVFAAITRLMPPVLLDAIQSLPADTSSSERVVQYDPQSATTLGSGSKGSHSTSTVPTIDAGSLSDYHRLPSTWRVHVAGSRFSGQMGGAHPREESHMTRQLKKVNAVHTRRGQSSVSDRLVIAPRVVGAVLAVRFRVAQMLDSLVSAVSLFRLVRMMAAVVEECCSIPFPGGDDVWYVDTLGREKQMRTSGTSREYRNLAGIRVHVQGYGMTVVFLDQRPLKLNARGHKQVGGYSAMLHAAYAASAAIARIEALQKRLGAILSVSAAVHVGGVVLGTMGAEGQAWDAYGRGISDAAALASASAAVMPPDRSSLAISSESVKETNVPADQLLEGMTMCLGPKKQRSLRRFRSGNSLASASSTSRSRRFFQSSERRGGGQSDADDGGNPRTTRHGGLGGAVLANGTKLRVPGQISVESSISGTVAGGQTGPKAGGEARGAAEAEEVPHRHTGYLTDDGFGAFGSDTDGSLVRPDDQTGNLDHGGYDSNGYSKGSSTSVGTDESAEEMVIERVRLRIRGVAGAWTTAMHARILKLCCSKFEPYGSADAVGQLKVSHSSRGGPSLAGVRRASDLSFSDSSASSPAMGSMLKRRRSSQIEVPTVETMIRWLQAGQAPSSVIHGLSSMRASMSMSHHGKMSESVAGSPSQQGRGDSELRSVLSFTSAVPAVVDSQKATRAGYKSHWAAIFLARLKRLRLLGAGAFGKVFMVRDVASGAPAALKLFQKKQILRDEVRSEVVSLAALPQHPGVMRLIMCLAMTDRVALVTEFIKGTTLSTLVNGKTRLRPHALQIVLAQLVCAIGVCHESGILHRDIKPANIMVSGSEAGHCKLIDFGLAKRLHIRSAPPPNYAASFETISDQLAGGNAESKLTTASEKAQVVPFGTHHVYTSTTELFTQLEHVSPCLTLEQAHLRMAAMRSGSALPSLGTMGSPMLGALPSSGGASGVQMTPLSVRSGRMRLMTSMSLLVFDYNIAGGKHTDVAKRLGRKYLRLRRNDRMPVAAGDAAAGPDKARHATNAAVPGDDTSPTLGTAGRQLLSSAGDLHHLIMRLSDAPMQWLSHTRLGDPVMPLWDEDSKLPKGTLQDSVKQTRRRIHASEVQDDIGSNDLSKNPFFKVLAHKPRVALPTLTSREARVRLKESTDVFQCLDQEQRVTPSLVWSTSQLHSAIETDGPDFDTVMITDAEDVESTVGLLVLLSASVYHSYKRALSEICAPLGGLEKAHGKSGRQESPPSDVDTDANDKDENTGADLYSPSTGIPCATLQAALPFVAPRIVVVLKDNLAPEMGASIRTVLRLVAPGSICLDPVAPVEEVYRQVVLRGFARAARWQGLNAYCAAGSNPLQLSAPVKLLAQPPAVSVLSASGGTQSTAGTLLRPVKQLKSMKLPEPIFNDTPVLSDTGSMEQPAVAGLSNISEGNATSRKVGQAYKLHGSGAIRARPGYEYDPDQYSSTDDLKTAATAPIPPNIEKHFSAKGLTRRSDIERALAQSASPILELKQEVAKGFAGSPAYIAPEIIKGYPFRGFSSDWYSLGVCAFKLACGMLPIQASSTKEALQYTKAGRLAWERLSRQMDPLLLDLIVGLLEHDPMRRYGARGGARHLMRHPYFSKVDWDNIYARKSPLADRRQCTTTLDTDNCFEDRASAVDFIRYARGVVANMPLSPLYDRIGGWRGMPPDMNDVYVAGTDFSEDEEEQESHATVATGDDTSKLPGPGTGATAGRQHAPAGALLHSSKPNKQEPSSGAGANPSNSMKGSGEGRYPQVGVALGGLSRTTSGSSRAQRDGSSNSVQESRKYWRKRLEQSLYGGSTSNRGDPSSSLVSVDRYTGVIRHIGRSSKHRPAGKSSSGSQDSVSESTRAPQPSGALKAMAGQEKDTLLASTGRGAIYQVTVSAWSNTGAGGGRKLTPMASSGRSSGDSGRLPSLPPLGLAYGGRGLPAVVEQSGEEEEGTAEGCTDYDPLEGTIRSDVPASRSRDRRRQREKKHRQRKLDDSPGALGQRRRALDAPLEDGPSKKDAEVSAVLAEAFRQGKVRSLAMASSVHGHANASEQAVAESGGLTEGITPLYRGKYKGPWD